MSLGRCLALGWLILVVGAALGADLLASSRPILAERAGALRWRPEAAAAAAPTRRGWNLSTPLADPLDVRPSGQLAPLSPPSAARWLGTDDRGRDVAARLVHGARTSALVAAVAAGAAALIAIAFGLLAVRCGGPVLLAIATLADVIATAPALLGVIAAQGLLGVRGIGAVAVLLAVPRGADGARLLVAQLRVALAAPFVLAARATGASPGRILVRHALPQAAPALAAHAAITAATAVLAEAALTFLGLGAAPPTASWGELLAQAVQHPEHGWLSLPVGTVITLTTAALLRIARADRARV